MKLVDAAKVFDTVVPVADVVLVEPLLGAVVGTVAAADVADVALHPAPPEQLTDRNTVVVAAPSPADARIVYACRAVNAVGDPENVPLPISRSTPGGNAGVTLYCTPLTGPDKASGFSPPCGRDSPTSSTISAKVYCKP
jgi:hypothetical protein